MTSNGDFACVVNFLLENKFDVAIVTPNFKDCSVFLRRIAVSTVDLSQHAHKFTQKEKASTRDESRAGPFPSDNISIDNKD